MNIIINLIIMTLAVYIAAYLTPGVIVVNLFNTFLAAVVLGILNSIIKPILLILTLPVTIITFGLFIFVLNAAMVLLASQLVEGFYVENFLAALIFSLVLSIVSYFLSKLGK